MFGELLQSVDYSTIALASGCAVCFIAWLNSGTQNNLPPSPRGLPVLGILPIFFTKLRAAKHIEYVIGLHKKIGSIFTFKAGAIRFVWISDGKLVKEMFKREEFAFRPVDSLPVLKMVNEGKPKGIGLSNGENNTEMRRFALLALRDFGVGKKGLEEIVQTEASSLVEYLEKLAAENNGVVSEITEKMQSATANIIHTVIFGFRNDYNDASWNNLLRLILSLSEVNPLAAPINFFPALRNIPFIQKYISGGMHMRLAFEDDIKKYINAQIDDHRKNYSRDEIRDFIDLFIKYETEQREFYDVDNIYSTIVDLFSAGIITTAISLSWCTIFLAKFPKVQSQLIAEIDEVVGDQVFDRKVKDRLVKTRAFINEMLRFASIAGFSAPHTARHDTDFAGYTIPTGSLVLANIFAMHHDKEYWGDPEVFKIDRWIGEDGQFLLHDEYFMPFSIGKRACPGRQLALIEILSVLVVMLQNFKFEKPEGMPELSAQPGAGLIRAPKNFHVKIIKRT